ncbi:energy transducer TonB [Granulicella arctica]|uniref:TonB family protein n=1 Tax=Granulicella arctica TaxID=940613 RepID=A0A7Y9PJX5_9BACT|nr:energy transducer TonB [Granulicella arctica]NYF81212.1 TonB family protein [Granulicella arctica]
MAKSLGTEVLAPPQSIQFTHFGVLDDGQRSKASFFTSLTINVLLAIIVVILGMAAKKISDSRPHVTMLVAPVILKPAPEIIKPRVLPKLPPPPKIQAQPPKITVPQVKVPEVPKPQVVKMAAAPVITPAPPKRIIAPAAPAAVNLARPQAASVPNNSPHPSAIALGRPDNPIAPSNLPATSSVNLGQRGLAGMPASNSGGGPPATRVNLGSGSPGSGSLSGNGTRAVAGVRLGVPGGTGPNNATGRVAGPVNLGVAAAATPSKPLSAYSSPVRTGPKVIYKPHPEYTAEARALHLEGTVSVRLRVSASGSVQVLGVSSGLGHGLDQAAENAVRSTRFQPAMDAAGHPIDWEGIVNVAFQLAS